MAFLGIQKSIFLSFSMIFDPNKPKLAFCNPFRDILANFQQFLTIPEILAIFLSWLLHLSSLWSDYTEYFNTKFESSDDNLPDVDSGTDMAELWEEAWLLFEDGVIKNEEELFDYLIEQGWEAADDFGVSFDDDEDNDENPSGLRSISDNILPSSKPINTQFSHQPYTDHMAISLALAYITYDESNYMRSGELKTENIDDAEEKVKRIINRGALRRAARKRKKSKKAIKKKPSRHTVHTNTEISMFNGGISAFEQGLGMPSKRR